MSLFARILKPVVAALAVIFAPVPPVLAEEPPDSLFGALAAAESADAARMIADDIRTHWARSGSAAMDLLLQRGRGALEKGDVQAALEHLTALTDHAPGFAEGWHARAHAYFAAELTGPAVDDLRRALSLSPRHFDAMVGLGVILDLTGAPEDALSVLNMAHDIYPHHPETEAAIERLEARLRGRDA